MYLGLDLLGAAKFSKLASQETPAGWLYGVFTNVVGFGDAQPAVKRAIRKGVVAGFRLNLSWEDDHNFDDHKWTQQIREARRWEPMIRANPGMVWYVSGATEHTLTEGLAKSLRDAVMRQLPASVIYVNNPLRGGAKKGSFILGDPHIVNEVHGSEALVPPGGGRFAFSADGSDAFDFDITAMKTRFAGAEYFMFWTSQCNGRKNTADDTPRPQRIAYPTAELLEALVFLHTTEGATNVPDRYLLKSKSDQHTVPPAPRELKPVVIIPPKVSKIEFISMTSTQVIHTSSAPMEFVDGRFRYYFNEFGYKIALKAAAIQSGDPRVRLRVNGRIMGVVNPAFRIGDFRP